MKHFIRSRIASFGHAFRGLYYVIRTQRNAWIHALATVLAIIFGIWLMLPARDWAVLGLTIAIVWIAEILNTAIEAVVDLASPNFHALAKIGKDTGAAAVLVASFTAVFVGLLILGPPLWNKIFVWFAVK